jgi:WD40 repeat protein
LITTTSRGQVAVWSLPSGKLLREPVQLPTTIQPAEMTADGRYFATGSTDGLVRLWDSATGRPVREMKHGSEINAVSFSPDGRALASAGEDRIVRIWDTRSGQLLRELSGHQTEVLKVMFSPDGRRVVTASPDFTARLWDPASGRQLRVLPHQGEVVDVTFSPDGRLVVTGARDRTAVIWDANTGLPLEHALPHGHAVRNVRFSPDGRRLLTLDFRGLRLWDVASGHPLTVHLRQGLESGIGFQSNAIGPHFSPDGNTLLVACGSDESLLWHLPAPPATIPAWFPEFLEAVAGLRFEAGTDIPALVPAATFLELRRRLQDSTDSDYYTRWARQWLGGRDEIPAGSVTP